jgi:phage terminase small subunit
MAQVMTKRQERFVLAILQGQSQSDAYKTAGYMAGKPGSKSQDTEAVAKAASHVAHSATVSEALARARAVVVERQALTVEDLVGMLLHSREVAFKCEPPQVAASVAAAMGIAKLLGLVIDRSKVEMTLHKPAFSSAVLELSEAEWKAQFDPAQKKSPT